MKHLGFAIVVSAALTLLAAPACGQTADTGNDFVEAVRSGDGATVTDLLNDHSIAIINARSRDGDTALVAAIAARNEEFTGFLLNKGADPNLAGKGGELPLTAAARSGFDTAIAWLLSKGAKVDRANRLGETALIIAVQNRDKQLVRLLLASSADPDKADHAQGFSARDYAARDPRARDILKLIADEKPAP